MRIANTIFLVIIFCASLHAEVLYKDINHPSYDYFDIPVESLKDDVNKEKSKPKYLLALHMVHEGSKEEGVHELELLAAEGVLDANEKLYEISSWVDIDHLTKEKALEYLKKGAEGGFAISQWEMAKVYNGVALGKADPVNSYFWAEKAALQGHKKALAYVSRSHFSGHGVPASDRQGFEWLMKAEKLLGRDFNDWFLLAEVYKTGRGTPVDLVKAYMCYDLIGTAGIENKEALGRRMTAAQRAEGLRLSKEWQLEHHVYTLPSWGLTRQDDGTYK